MIIVLQLIQQINDLGYSIQFSRVNKPIFYTCLKFTKGAKVFHYAISLRIIDDFILQTTLQQFIGDIKQLEELSNVNRS